MKKMGTRKQEAYNIVSAGLNAIGCHPRHVDTGALGYFMCVANIKKYIVLDPSAWFKIFKNEQNVSFKDSEKEDQDMVTFAIRGITKVISDPDLRDACGECLRISTTFDNKILGMT